MLKLAAADGPEYLITRAETTIGRREDNAIVFDDKRVSSRHAVIVARGADYILTDAGSMNGTYVNGERLSGAYRLQDGDIVQIGGVLLTVHLAPTEGGAPRLLTDDEGDRFSAPTEPDAAPPPPAGAKDRMLMLLLEVLPGLAGFLGIGWIAAGEARRGLLIMAAGLLGLGVGVVFSIITLGLGACLAVPLWLVAIGLSAWRLWEYMTRHPDRFS